MRYIHSLVSKDFSLIQGMIPLGSCTMKLNAANTAQLLKDSGIKCIIGGKEVEMADIAKSFTIKYASLIDIMTTLFDTMDDGQKVSGKLRLKDGRSSVVCIDGGVALPDSDSALIAYNLLDNTLRILPKIEQDYFSVNSA